ncbi:hypothetical protein Zmor_005697 [Zophobas morio]|uniref:7tm 6 domain containing protein n=1 Tax=Zophobas morio TaxID=2755281 RepID=A0AA38MM33_9CUCU|nr:hypothetical protein Zmor_005697 [Zophobas morio]
MQDKLFQPKNSSQEKIAMSTFKIFDIMYLTHMIGPTICVIFFAVYPLAEMKQTKNKTLPFNGWYPFDYKISPFFELTYFHQLVGSFIAAQTQVNIDCLAIYMIAMLTVQVDILADNVRNISAKNEENETEKSMDSHLFDCIKHHTEILT